MFESLLNQRPLSDVVIPLPFPVLPLRFKCPSVLDPRFRGDAYIVNGSEDTLTIYLGNYNLAQLPGTSLDLPHLNALLARLRQEICSRRTGACQVLR